jgi:predicted AAA+ superfamily ATPase
MTLNTIQKEVLNQKEEFVQMRNKDFLPRKIDALASDFLSSPLIKVILGPRRAGKSTFCIQALKNKEVAYLNFDNQILSKASHQDILESLKEIYKDVNYYFFDEIQNLKEWELLVNGLHRVGKNVIVTGSNSKLLSRELATALTGRHIPLYIFPFDYQEFLSAKNINRSENSLLAYIKNGGYPELINNSIPNYLNTLLDSLVLKDIVDRYKLRNVSDLQNLADYLLGNPALTTTLASLRKTLELKSVTTVAKYINNIEEVFAIIKLERFTLKQKERFTGYKKIYPIDCGYIEIKKQKIQSEEGRVLESFVAIELYKKSKATDSTLFYYQNKNKKEIDFALVKNGTVISCVQVALSLHHNNYKREIDSLYAAGRELETDNLIIYTLNSSQEIIDYAKNKGVLVKYAWEI